MLLSLSCQKLREGPFNDLESPECFPQASLGKRFEKSLGTSSVVLPNQKPVLDPITSLTRGQDSQAGSLSLIIGGAGVR